MCNYSEFFQSRRINDIHRYTSVFLSAETDNTIYVCVSVLKYLGQKSILETQRGVHFEA